MIGMLPLNIFAKRDSGNLQGKQHIKTQQSELSGKKLTAGAFIDVHVYNTLYNLYHKMLAMLRPFWRLIPVKVC